MSFSESTLVKCPRKSRRCVWCGDKTEIGKPVLRIAGVTDDGFSMSFWHPECEAAFHTLPHDTQQDWVDDYSPELSQRGTTEPKQAQTTEEGK